MWHEWKQMFVSCMDKHAPRKLKRISKKRAPWITKGLLNKMNRRDLIKKKASSSNNHDMWEQFKCARNQANNAIKQAKERYFSDNLKVSKGNPRKTRNLINELTSRNTSKSMNILEIQVDNRTISRPGDMVEAFNEHFTIKTVECFFLGTIGLIVAPWKFEGTRVCANKLHQIC